MANSAAPIEYLYQHIICSKLIIFTFTVYLEGFSPANFSFIFSFLLVTRLKSDKSYLS